MLVRVEVSKLCKLRPMMASTLNWSSSSHSLPISSAIFFCFFLPPPSPRALRLMPRPLTPESPSARSLAASPCSATSSPCSCST